MHPRWLFALALATPSLAHADILSIRAEAHGGGGGGAGVGGERKDEAFSAGTRGAGYGALVGAEVLFIDAWIQHHQFPVDGATATWTQFMTGLDLNLDLGTPEPVPGAAAKTKARTATETRKARPKGYFEVGLGFGFGVGTGQQVMLPLDNSEITDKGFLAELKLGGGIHLGPVFSLGLSVPISAGYYFKSGAGVVNDVSTHYQAVQAEVLLNLRFRLQVK